MKKRRIVALFNDYTAQIVYSVKDSGLGIKPVLSYADEIISVPGFECYQAICGNNLHSLNFDIYSAIYETEEEK